MCRARVMFCLADGLGLFAVRLPSLSRRMECGDSGITEMWLDVQYQIS